MDSAQTETTESVPILIPTTGLLRTDLRERLDNLNDDATEVDFGNSNINDADLVLLVPRLHNFPNLTTLDFDDNQVVDISSVSTLTNLTALVFDENQVIDISSLSTLTNLTELWFDGNQVVNISSLSTLTNLNNIYLENNPIQGIIPPNIQQLMEDSSSNQNHSTALQQHPSFFVQSERIPKDLRDQTLCSNLRGNLEKHWLMIYAYLDLSFVDRLKMRFYCRLFHKVEIILTLNRHCYAKMLAPIPKYTWFPHPNYPTLNGLMDKLNEEYAALPSGWVKCTAPETLSLEMEVRVIYGYVDSSSDDEYSDNSDEDNDTEASFKDATIEKVNDDETFDVVFDEDDDETRKNVPLNELQIQNVSVVDL